MLGTEKHESRRVDNQLRGRSGRQGDIGESRFFLSLEDDMYTRFAKEELEKLKPKVQTDATGLVTNAFVHELTERTQRIVEGIHYSMREYNLKLDDVINDQRNVIYKLRNEVIQGEKLYDNLQTMIEELVDFVVYESCPDDHSSETWDFAQIERTLNALLLEPIEIPETVTSTKEVFRVLQDPLDELLDYMLKFSEDERVLQVIPQVMLAHIDTTWVKHLEAMTRLKEGIGLRSYSQEDPMRIYQREGLEIFGTHYQALRRNIAQEIIRFMNQYNEQISVAE